jgi:hypothetical protein
VKCGNVVSTGVPFFHRRSDNDNGLLLFLVSGLVIIRLLPLLMMLLLLLPPTLPRGFLRQYVPDTNKKVIHNDINDNLSHVELTDDVICCIDVAPYRCCSTDSSSVSDGLF